MAEKKLAGEVYHPTKEIMDYAHANVKVFTHLPKMIL